MAKKKHHAEEHENHERWLVSYADFITLLFAFFVVMYSVSRVDNKRVQQASESIKWAMHFEGTGGIGQMPIFEGPASAQSIVTLGTPSKSNIAQYEAVEVLRRRLERRVHSLLSEPASVGNAVRVIAEGGRLTLRLSATHFFDGGSAAVRPDALTALDAIATELAALGRPIRIEGHTDDSQTTGPRFRNNWELSAARAASVTAYLEGAHEIKPELLSATGFASTRPIATNETPEGREANRRIEMSIEAGVGDPLSFAAR